MVCVCFKLLLEALLPVRYCFIQVLYSPKYPFFCCFSEPWNSY